MTNLQTGIKTARLTLRNLRPDDADALFLLFQEPDTLQFTRYREAKARLDFDRLFTEQFLDNSTAAAIQRSADGIVIGFIEMHEGGVLTYAIRQEFWSHGYVTEAGRAFVDTMFATQPIALVKGEFANQNKASGRVLAKIGLHYADEIGPFTMEDGQEIMVTQYTMTREEWTELSGKMNK